MTLEKTFEKWTPRSPGAPASIPGELITDYRARLAAEQSDALKRRRSELAEQSSELNTPEQRIRIWERLHALDLPREAIHPLLRLIATGTGLTLEQVRDEQRQRSAPTPKQPQAGVKLAVE
jgi:hypothetical protein